MLGFSAVLIAYDAAAATIAKVLTISYNSFLVLSLVIVFFMGVFAGRVAGSWLGILPVVVAAIVDATIGWYVAALIGPGYIPGWTMRQLLTLAVESVLLSTAIGCVGVWVGMAVAGARRGIF
ncbi:MAG: hypothetical protein JO104_02730 [Candidatus Eremiobacteraeota bacterium]|nr:hypothetical protein [Candidatus Eremiobacteraeota bacterium]